MRIGSLIELVPSWLERPEAPNMKYLQFGEALEYTLQSGMRNNEAWTGLKLNMQKEKE